MKKIDLSILFHYIVVFGVILLTWIPYMSITRDNVIYTSLLSFVTFVIADQLAHLLILGEKIDLIK